MRKNNRFLGVLSFFKQALIVAENAVSFQAPFETGFAVCTANKNQFHFKICCMYRSGSNRRGIGICRIADPAVNLGDQRHQRPPCNEIWRARSERRFLPHDTDYSIITVAENAVSVQTPFETGFAVCTANKNHVNHCCAYRSERSRSGIGMPRCLCNCQRTKRKYPPESALRPFARSGTKIGQIAQIPMKK